MKIQNLIFFCLVIWIVIGNTITNSTTPTNTEQPVTKNASSNDTIKNKTNEVNTTKPIENSETVNKSNFSDIKSPLSQGNLADSTKNSSTTNQASNSIQKTTQANSSTKKSPVSQKNTPFSLMQLLAQSDLVNCAQFAITSEGIVCLTCKQNYIFDLDKSCVPCLPTQTNSSTWQKTTTDVVTTIPNITTNELKKAAEVINSSTSSDKSKSKNETATEPRITIESKNQSSNEVSSKINNSQTNITPTFIPLIATNTKSQNNQVTNTNSPQNSSSIVQNSTFSIDLFYSLPTNNNSIPNTDNPIKQSTTPANNMNNNLQALKYPLPIRPSDPNCVQANPAYSLKQPISGKNKRCLKCYRSYYYNIDQQICSQANPKCRTADQQNSCLSCYPGYQLSKGDCIIGNSQQYLSGILVKSVSPISSAQTTSFIDPNCNKFTPNSNQCILCAVNYYLSNGICRQVNPLCKTFNRDNGNCLSCYHGYKLNTTTQPISCSISSITQCKTYDKNTGNCLTCYTGYYLSEGTCTQISIINDPFCNLMGSSGCQQCIQRYYPDQNGVCRMVSLLCANYNQSNGACFQCILLYTLVNGQCVYLQ